MRKDKQKGKKWKIRDKGRDEWRGMQEHEGTGRKEMYRDKQERNKGKSIERKRDKHKKRKRRGTNRRNGRKSNNWVGK